MCVPQEDKLTKYKRKHSNKFKRKHSDVLKRKHSDMEGANGDIGEESSKLLHLPSRVGSPASVSNFCVRYAYVTQSEKIILIAHISRFIMNRMVHE